jgi:SIR2-like protein
MPDSPQKVSAFDAWTTKSDEIGMSRGKNATIVFLTKDQLDKDWMVRVSKDEKNATTVFLEPDGDSFRVHAYSEGDSQPPSVNDLRIAATAVTRQSRKFRNREISFVTDEGTRKIKPTPDAKALTHTTILSQQALEEHIKSENIGPLDSLVEQLRSPVGVMPLVGAGMSAAIRFSTGVKGFPQWSELLLNIARGRTIEPAIKRFIDKGDYERAAEKLDDDRPGVLPRKIKHAFNRKVDRAQLENGALSYLPYLVNGPVITTNYDRVLEQVFEVAEKTLHMIPGPLPDEIVNAIHQNERALLKIHGDCRDRTFRVLTVKEYEAAYGVAKDSSNERASVGKMAWLMFTNRPLLCLGCSLESDRTTHVLKALQQELRGLTHYAILAGHYSTHRWEVREKQLDRMGVTPLWYPPGEYKQIEALLRELLERASTRPLSVTATSDAKTTPHDAVAATQRFRDLGRLIKPKNRSAISKQLLHGMTEALRDGKLAFFLGTYAHLGNTPLAREFYEKLATEFKIPALSGNRSAVAAFIVSRHGSEALWQRVRAMLFPILNGPSAVHRLLAALPAVLRNKKEAKAGPLWIFTTNYDTMMEEAFNDAGEPFHLLYYAGGTATENEGLFIEQRADGSVRVIERPDNMRSLNTDAPVIVKLNGGLVYKAAFPESVVISTGHYERLAAGIPNVLPLYVRRALREKSLLFMGHGLIEPDVHAVIKYAAPADRTVKSWAIQLPPTESKALHAWNEQAKYWRGWGLEIVDADLSDFLKAIHTEWRNRLR